MCSYVYLVISTARSRDLPLHIRHRLIVQHATPTTGLNALPNQSISTALAQPFPPLFLVRAPAVRRHLLLRAHVGTCMGFQSVRPGKGSVAVAPSTKV